MKQILQTFFAGLLGGFVGNGVLGALFSGAFVRQILYDPARQSALFLEITPTRDIPVSVAGLVVLSVIHAWLFVVLRSSLPGRSRFSQGVAWGLTIWAMYWLFQEWFIYHTLLREPLALCLLELAILLIGSVVEGVIISFAVPTTPWPIRQVMTGDRPITGNRGGLD